MYDIIAKDKINYHRYGNEWLSDDKVAALYFLETLFIKLRKIPNLTDYSKLSKEPGYIPPSRLMAIMGLGYTETAQIVKRRLESDFPELFPREEPEEDEDEEEDEDNKEPAQAPTEAPEPEAPTEAPEPEAPTEVPELDEPEKPAPATDLIAAEIINYSRYDIRYEPANGNGNNISFATRNCVAIASTTEVKTQIKNTLSSAMAPITLCSTRHILKLRTPRDYFSQPFKDLPFPEPKAGVLLIVDLKVAEAAKASGRSTADLLIPIPEKTRSSGPKCKIVEEFYQL